VGGFLVGRALASGRGLGWAGVWALSFLLATLYGVTDEVHQSFVPGRNPDWRDVVADGLGALLGAGVTIAVAHLRSRGRHGVLR
jgi:VanZ family protein